MHTTETKNENVEFTSLGLRPELIEAVARLGFETPTPVQVAAIPPALEGKDVLASAMTGSGKTAAFVLPILQRLAGKPRGVTRALVLTPTRELAAQVAEHFAALAGSTGVKVVVVHGGVSARPQEDALRRGVDVIVATPGRLLDHLGTGRAKLDGLEVLVFDEADRMLDMGFMPDVRRILRHLPKSARQTLFFSATMPDPIVELSREMLRSPVRISVGRKPAPAKGVTQALYPVPSHHKVRLLIALLEGGHIGNAIVFCRTKHRANRLAERLERSGISVGRIHGNRSQGQRTEALAAFKSGRSRVLVATDIVARGIDVEALDHVVNFDVPNQPEDYIHRVGRTARAEATGDAYTLVSPEEESGMRAIERMVGRPIERRTLETFDYAAAAEPRLEVPLAERLRGIRAARGGNGGGGRSRRSPAAPARGEGRGPEGGAPAGRSAGGRGPGDRRTQGPGGRGRRGPTRAGR